MSEVGTADRSRLLRTKRSELSQIVTSRKRKLRELFAVCDNEGPIPQITYSSPDAPSTTKAEEHFLDFSDLEKDRIFDESNLPARRQLRSDSSKALRTPTRKASPDTRGGDASRKTKAQRDGSKSRSRAPTPGTKNDSTRTTPVVEAVSNAKPAQSVPMERSTSKSSQTDLPAESSAVLSEIVEEIFANAAKPPPQMQDVAIAAENLEKDRIRTIVESRSNSPGVDPKKAMPILPEDAAQLSETGTNGLVVFQDPNHKAVTAHLPPKDVQEKRFQESEQAHKDKEQEQRKEQEVARLAISLPPRDAGKNAEPLSSPSSTIGANSAATPALHDVSTDTSPDNESSRYDADRTENDDDVSTPTELRPAAEEVAEKDKHDRILKAQMDISRGEILASSPTAADNQLRMEEEAALNAQAAEAEMDDSQKEPRAKEDKDDALTKEANEIVQGVVEDIAEPVDEPPSADVEMFGVEAPIEKPKESEPKQPEIPDSEAQTPADVMDVDVTTVKDSFESTEDNQQPATANPTAPIASVSVPTPVVDSGNSTAPPASSSRRTPSTPAIQTPVIERMTTRVSSGAMRHKSVSEILGEIPKPNNNSSDRSVNKTESGSPRNSSSLSRSATPQSPSGRVRSHAEKARDRERSKLSTVVFQKHKPNSNSAALMPSGSQAAQPPKEDYLKPLFIANATSDKRGIPALDGLLATAHKTITTSNAYVPIQESQNTKILKRIYSLQNANKWALRQPKRAAEPNRPTTHWDVLLQEAKWMRTDFREERKWKRTVAANLVHACAEWVRSDPVYRKLLQVQATSPPVLPPDGASNNAYSMEDLPHSTPDLVGSGWAGSPMDDFDEEPRLNLLETIAPTAIFALQDDDIVFGLRRSPAADKLLDELPMYGSPLQVPQSDLPTSEIDPDRLWRRPALPLTKYIEGRMELKFDGPPRKKSRFQYESEDDDDDEVVFGAPGQKRPHVPPEKNDVALFNPEHKHIRDRIHSSHQFRPPSEFQMPLQSFFETRVASQWTWDEDNELKTLVREYTYNWSLISSMLQSKSLFSSGAERRTPWECFERWIHLEGLPADMQKTHYFRAYTTRIEAANRSVIAQQTAAQPQAMANGQVQPAQRRRTTSGIRVERRRNQKHLTLVDAMRKLAKKRETSHQKQLQAANMAALRKANDNQHAPQRGPAQTPQYFSRVKQERDEMFKERILAVQQRQEAHRRAMVSQQRNVINQPGVLPNGVPQPRGPPVNGNNGLLAPPPNGPPGPPGQNLAVPGQNRASRPMGQQMGQPMPNNLQPPQMGMSGVPPAPMQSMQGQLPMPNPAVSVGLINQAQRTAEEQRTMIQMQQQGKLPGQSPQMHNSPPRMNGHPQPGFPLQQQNMLSFNTNSNVNGASTPPTGMTSSPGQPHGQAGSPRMGQPPQLNPQVAHYEQQLKIKYPHATQEQIMSMIAEQLKRNQQQRQGLAQSAMNAAAGATNGMAVPGQRLPVGVENSPQLYAQMMRQQQDAQQKKNAEARQATVNAANASQGQNGAGSSATSSGQQAQGHAHRNSSGSVHSAQ